MKLGKHYFCWFFNAVIITNLLFAAAIPTVCSAFDIKSLIKVKGDNTQQCVEYFLYRGESYCSTQPLTHEKVDPAVKNQDMQIIQFDDRAWRAAWFHKDDHSTIIEYVPEDEDINNWNELVTSQFFGGLQEKASPEEFMNAMVRQLNQAGFQPVINVIKKTPDRVIYEFRILSPKAQAQDELQKIVKGKDGLYVLHYVIKKPDMGAEKRKEWIAHLEASKIKGI